MTPTRSVSEAKQRVSSLALRVGVPDQIPDGIAYGDNLHLQAYPGDHGIQYEKGPFDLDDVPLRRVAQHSDSATEIDRG